MNEIDINKAYAKWRRKKRNNDLQTFMLIRALRHFKSAAVKGPLVLARTAESFRRDPVVKKAIEKLYGQAHPRRKRTPEQRERMRQAALKAGTGKWVRTPEHREKARQSALRRWAKAKIAKNKPVPGVELRRWARAKRA